MGSPRRRRPAHRARPHHCPVPGLRPRAEDALPGAVPARLPTAAAAAGAGGLHLAHGQCRERRCHGDAAGPREPQGDRPRARAPCRRAGCFGSSRQGHLQAHAARRAARRRCSPYEQQLVNFLFHEIAGGNELVLERAQGPGQDASHRLRQGLPDVEEQGRRRRASSAATSTPQADRMAFTALGVRLHRHGRRRRRRASSAGSGGSSSASRSGSC